MRRVGRTVRIVFVLVAMLAGGAAVSGYGGRALSALRDGHGGRRAGDGGW